MGPPGAAIANRLSADPSTSVLVLEAGRSDYRMDPLIHMPAALPIPIGNRLYDWKYETDPEPYMNGRKIFHARGKVLGGSSSINGMIFQRGNPMDYERWAADPGMETWDYLHCLPYFKRMETCLAGADDWRGGGGPLLLERGPADEPTVRRVLRGGPTGRLPADRRRQRLPPGGVREVRPQHPPRPPHVGLAGLPVARAAPEEPPHRDARVRRQDQLRGHARGRRRLLPRRSPASTATAGEVILCAGAISTPQLLQLSGVGDKTLLEQHGLDVVEHVPGVGENLQDHLEVYIQYKSKLPVSIAPGLRYRERPKIAFQWLFQRKGLGSTNHFEGGGFARSNDDVDYPNLMFHFLPIAIRYDGTAPTKGHGYQVHIGPMYADTRGHVRIKSTDPRVHPSMQFNYLSTPTDRREWVEAVRVARDILNQPAFGQYNDGELSPGPSVETDEEILDWVRDDAETALHPSCTAKMGDIGRDAMAVTDPGSMRVHGTEGLRVVDASVFPYVTNGNIYAPVMMTAEKSADLIAGNTPLEPATVPYYRYRDGSPLHPPGDSRNREDNP